MILFHSKGLNVICAAIFKLIFRVISVEKTFSDASESSILYEMFLTVQVVKHDFLWLLFVFE